MDSERWALGWTLVMDLKSTLVLTGGSACCFKLLNTATGVLPTPQAAQRKAWKWRNISTSLAHSCLTGAGAVSWCVRGSAVRVGVVVFSSWDINCFSGLSPCSFYLQPQMMEDLISFCSLHSHILVTVSTGDARTHITYIYTFKMLLYAHILTSSAGYFIHDFLDMALNQPVKQAWDLLLHHSLVMTIVWLMLGYIYMMLWPG